MNVPASRKPALSLLLVGVVALSVASCGGNRAPTISGTPAVSITQGTAYSFTPTATDLDGNALTFSVTNLPEWATFEATTGGLTGRPSAAQIGSYNNITISVSDGSTSASLPPFSIQVVGTAPGFAVVAWTPPTEKTDGTPLTDLAGYRIYWGNSEGSYANSVTVNDPTLDVYVVDQLTPARWYFVVTAITKDGVESNLSNVASKQVR